MSKPPGYDSWKILIEYLDANLRFELFRCAPSLRILEKLIPLTIDSLCFDHLETKVNDTKYTLGIYRDYPPDQEIPKYHKLANEEGGCEYDLSKHGFKLYFYNEAVTPGDVNLKTDLNERDLGEEDDEAAWERALEIHEFALTQKKEQMENEEEFYFGTKTNPRLRFSDLEITQLERLSRLPIENLQEEVKSYKARLAPYHCRRDNTLPPYTPKIQLTVESPRGKQTFLYGYNMKLNQAMKKLNAYLLGERREAIQVRSLIVRKTIIRLPLDVKFKIREMQLSEDPNSVYKAFQHVVDESSYPLISMVLSSGQAMDYDHSIVQTARKLIIRPNFSGLRTYLPILMNLQNKYTTVEIKHLPFPVGDQIELIENWREVDKEVGTYLAYGVSEENTAKKLFTQLEQQNIGNRVSENCVEIPMNMDKTLRISYSRNEDGENLAKTDQFTMPDWWVKMEVVAAKNDEEN